MTLEELIILLLEAHKVPYRRLKNKFVITENMYTFRQEGRFINELERRGIPYRKIRTREDAIFEIELPSEQKILIDDSELWLNGDSDFIDELYFDEIELEELGRTDDYLIKYDLDKISQKLPYRPFISPYDIELLHLNRIKDFRDALVVTNIPFTLQRNHFFVEKSEVIRFLKEVKQDWVKTSQIVRFEKINKFDFFELISQLNKQIQMSEIPFYSADSREVIYDGFTIENGLVKFVRYQNDTLLVKSNVIDHRILKKIKKFLGKEPDIEIVAVTIAKPDYEDFPELEIENDLSPSDDFLPDILSVTDEDLPF